MLFRSQWLVPHFEKMLYDNAQLARLYLHGYQVTGDQRYAQIVRETLDYLDRLGASGALQLRDGRTTISQMLAAGEAPLGVTVYPYDVEGLKSKGAPIDWALLDPTPGLLQPVSLARNAPHPYSAALLYDFLLSKDGQKVYAQMNRTPANPDVETSNPRERAAVSDPRLVFQSQEEPRAESDEMLKAFNEKILKKITRK